MNKYSTDCRCSPITYYFSTSAFLLLAICSLCALGMVGCTGSSASKRYITSFVDPDFFGKRYTWLAVHYQTSDLEYRYALEEAVVHELREKKGSAMLSSGLILPTRTWDSAAIQNALTSAGFDGYLRIVETDRWTETYHVPIQEKTTVKREAEQEKIPNYKGRGEQRNDSVIKVTETETSTTTTTGGYTGETLYRRVRIELIDLATGRIAWVGTTTIAGSITANAKYFGKNVAAQLRQDGMFVVVE